MLVEDEVDRIAAFLNMKPNEFVERFTDLLPSRKGLGLISKPNHECIFLEGNDCSIQAVKPRQCAGFPNTWNFPGWRDVCEAIPVPRPPPASASAATAAAALPS